jgi:hypothetical protein
MKNDWQRDSGHSGRNPSPTDSISASFAEIWHVLDSGKFHQNLAALTRFQHRPDSDNTGQILASGRNLIENVGSQPVRWNLTTGSQNSGTFDGRFELPTNFNARRRQILTNVHTKMKSLNSKNDLRFLKL